LSSFFCWPAGLATFLSNGQVTAYFALHSREAVLFFSLFFLPFEFLYVFAQLPKGPSSSGKEDRLLPDSLQNDVFQVPLLNDFDTNDTTPSFFLDHSGRTFDFPPTYFHGLRRHFPPPVSFSASPKQTLSHIPSPHSLFQMIIFFFRLSLNPVCLLFYPPGSACFPLPVLLPLKMGCVPLLRVFSHPFSPPPCDFFSLLFAQQFFFLQLSCLTN